MKNRILCFLILVLGVHLFATTIIPQPTEIQKLGGTWTLKGQVLIDFPASFTNFEKDLGSFLEQKEITFQRKGKQADKADISAQINKVCSDEAYLLKMTPQGIEIEAGTDAGAFYAIQTLKFLIAEKKVGQEISCVMVKDEPRFPYRSLMLDSSRHFQSPQAVKRVLDEMSLLKLNVLHWHLVDNNGWRIPIKSYPQLSIEGGEELWDTLETERNGAYTEEEIREIVNYAKERNIEIVPELDFPGHCAALLKVFPEFLCPSNRNRQPVNERQCNFDYHEVLCIGNPQLYPFLENIIRDTIELFDCSKLHIGGDEVDGAIWKKCPLCSEKLKSFKEDEEYQMQKAFLNRVCDIVHKQGVEVINWSENPQGGIPNVDYGQVWRAGCLWQQKKLIDQGKKVINSLGDYSYFDYPEYNGSCKSSWMPILSLDRVYNFRLIPIGYTKKEKEAVIGGECTIWTEEILTKDLDKTLFPRVLAFAEQMWSLDRNRSWFDFKRRFSIVQKWLELEEIEFGKPVNRSKLISSEYQIEAPLFNRNSFPEYALDDNDVTAYVSANKVKKGDCFTIRFPQRKIEKVEVITGGFYVFDAPYSQLDEALVEVSEDGEVFDPIGVLEKGQLAIELENKNKSYKAMRIRSLKDYNCKFCVNEIRIR